MIPRYSHPRVAELWSPRATYQAWLDIEADTLMAQRGLEIVPHDETQALFDHLQQARVGYPDVDAISQIEVMTQHDVVAFLTWLRDRVGEDGRWIHFGLTSSDLVDTAQGMRFREMHREVLSVMGNLVSAVTRATMFDTPIMGRTHGQIAEPMAMRARAEQWMANLHVAASSLSRRTSRMAVCKLSGPVGTYAHNPPDVEKVVATGLNLRPHGRGASQIAARAPLAAWANAANAMVQVCAKIAMDVRLMYVFNEATVPFDEGQVGSSAMAHKHNPIQAEQIGGFARLAQGYALMLQSLDGWLERDMAHSSVERVAVPDLWHITMYAIQRTADLVSDLTPRTGDGWDVPDGQVSRTTNINIQRGMDFEAARAEALQSAPIPVAENVPWFMRNYPGGEL